MNILNEHNVEDLGERWDIEINNSIRAIKNITNNFKELSLSEILQLTNNNE